MTKLTVKGYIMDRKEDYQIRKRLFAMLYEDYQQPIERYLETRVYNQEQASDLCQETFKQLWEFLCKETVVKQYAYYRNWLYKTAEYRAIDYLRRKKPIGYLSTLDSDAYTSSTEPSIEEEAGIITRLDLRNDLAQMSVRHQQIVRLIDQGLKKKDIAKELGIGASRVSEILRDVRTQLQPNYYPAAVPIYTAQQIKKLVSGLRGTYNWEENIKLLERQYAKKDVYIYDMDEISPHGWVHGEWSIYHMDADNNAELLMALPGNKLLIGRRANVNKKVNPNELVSVSTLSKPDAAFIDWLQSRAGALSQTGNKGWGCSEF